MEQYIKKSDIVAEIEKKKIPFKKDIDDGVYPTYLCALMDFEDFINTLEVKEVKEEPISVWHNMDEVPIKGEVIVVQTKDTFYGLSVQKGGSTYKNRNKDRYVRWAYASDLLNLSNVQRDAKNLKEPVSNDLEKAAYEYADGENPTCPCGECLIKTFKADAQWQNEHLWKDAQGDDLPEIDREVIALIEAFGHYKVIFAHRVDENAEIHTSIDGKPLVLHPKKHGKGGWNIPDVKFWLDCKLPKIKE